MLVFLTVLLSCCQSENKGRITVRDEMVEIVFLFSHQRQLNLNSDLQTTASAVYCTEAVTGIKAKLFMVRICHFSIHLMKETFVEYFYDDVVKWSN